MIRNSLFALAQRGAGTAPHGWRSLLQHLVGTYDILRAWKTRPAVCLAGLMHSIYSTDVYSKALWSFSERDAVCDLIGPEAERLVFLFASIDRNEFFAAASRDAAVTVTSRNTWEALVISPQEVADLLVLYMANVAEQGGSPEGLPRPWLAAASRLGGLLSRRSGECPAMFSGGTQSIEPSAEQELIARYCAATSNEPDMTKLDMGAIAELTGRVPEPLIWHGFVTLASGDARRASVIGAQAARLAEALPVPWDRRLTRQQWAELTEMLRGAGALNDREIAAFSALLEPLLKKFIGPQTFCARVAAMDWSGPKTTDIDGFARYVSQLRNTEAPPHLRFYPGLSSDAFYDPARFPIAVALEQHAPRIINEFESLGPDALHRESEPIDRQGTWEVAILYERGKTNDELVAKCPATAQILRASGVLQTLSGLAYFSRLSAGSRVAPHRGPTNLRLRCHLGIEVPAGCGIRVGGVDRTWERGQCLVINDALVHEAWNDGDRDRVVLVVDVWHPDLTETEIELLEGLQRYAAGHAANLQKYWDDNAKARSS